MSVPAGQQLLSLACLCLSWSSATSDVQSGLMPCILLGLASVCRWGCSERVMLGSNIEPHQPTFSGWSKGVLKGTLTTDTRDNSLVAGLSVDFENSKSYGLFWSI